MTASELDQSGKLAATTIDDMGALNAMKSGMPDPAILARMANEFFREFSLDSAATTNIPSAANVGGISTISPRIVAMPSDVAGIQLPSSVSQASAIANQANSLGGFSPTLDPSRLNTLPNSSIIPPVDVPAQTSLPGFSEASHAAGLSESAGFAFLKESRALFTTPPALPIQATGLPGVTKIPTERDVNALSSALGTTSIPGVSEASTAVSNPQIVGAISPALKTDPFLSYGFLDEIKTLAALDVTPFLAPLGSDLSKGNPSKMSSGAYDVQAIRRDFPILQERVNGRPLIWLDNAATTQKPQAVIDRLKYFYEHENSNIHRAAHTLAARATDANEAAREKTRRFLNAGSVEEIIFVRGATEAINLIAQSWGRKNVGKDDEIVITWLEHHANIVPWQMLCAEKGARLRVAPVDNDGQVILEEYEKLLGPKTKLVSLTHVSNALGTVTPVDEMVAMAHRHGAKVLVDGAQAVSHLRVDVQASDCDFYVFSGHKVFAPTGIGVVYGKKEVLDQMPPWQGGGNMISDVTFERTLYHGPPLRFEAGTGNIADAVGLGAAIDYLDRIGMPNITRHEHELLDYGMESLRRIPGLRLIGTAKEKTSVLSFVLDGFKTEEVGEALNREGIAVRSGHHCAQPILRRFGLESTVRPSLALYNTCEDVDALISAIWNLKNGRISSVI